MRFGRGLSVAATGSTHPHTFWKITRRMDAIRRFTRQTLDLFRSLSPGGRLLAALLCGVIVVSLAWLVRFQATESYEYLLGGQHFSRREIEAMEVAFANQGLIGSEVVGQQIRIPRGRKQEFLAALAKENSLPERFDPDDLLLEGGLLDSRDMRQQRQRVASQTKLAMLIEKMPGIEDASVQIDEVRVSTFPARVEKRAIALVSASGRRPLSSEEVRAIRDTVVGYVAGLEQTNVTVTDLEAMRAYPGGDDPRAASESANEYVRTKQMFEQLWRDKLQQRLANYEGLVVAVNVELCDATRLVAHNVESTRTESTQDDFVRGERVSAAALISNRPVSLVETEGDLVGESDSTNPQASSARATSPAATHPRDLSADESETPLDADSNLVPYRVTASLDVPRSLYQRVWEESWRRANPGLPANVQPPAASAETLARIEAETKQTLQQAVAYLMPTPVVHDDRNPRVVVTTYEDRVVAESAKLSAAETARHWLAEHWQSAAMLTLALFSLWLVRSFARGTQQRRIRETEAAHRRGFARTSVAESADVEFEDRPSALDDDVELEWTTPTASRSKGSEADLREQLRELVNSDPDAAAEALRNWIGDAA